MARFQTTSGVQSATATPAGEEPAGGPTLLRANVAGRWLEADRSTARGRRPKVFLPALWATLLVTAAGVYGTNLVYQSVLNGGIVRGLMGGLLLATAMLVVGTPFAFAQMVRKDARLAGRTRNGRANRQQ